MKVIRPAAPGAAPATGAASVLASLGWNYAGAAAAMLLQLGYVACTGRLVSPTAFGAYAVALTVVQMLGYFSTAGLATHVLRLDTLTRPAVRTALRLGAVSGVAFFLLAEAAAPLCGALWHMPALTPMLRVLACQLLVQAGASVTVTALRRTGLARPAVVCELAGQTCGITASLSLLAGGWNPLGLAVAQPAAAAVTFLAGLYAMAARAPIPSGPPVGARALLASSSFLAGFGIAEFVTGNAPLWVAGRVFGATVTGAFSRAAMLGGLVSQFLFQGLNSAVTPALAERRGSGLAGNRAVAHTVCSASGAAFLGLGALAGAGPAALGLLLGPGWEQACSLVPVLSVGAGMTLLCRSGMIIDQVRRATVPLLATQLAVSAVTAATLAAAVVHHSLPLLVAAAALGQAAGHAVQVLCWHRDGVLGAAFTLRVHAVHAAVGVTLGAAAAWGADGLAPGVAVVSATLSMLPVLLVCWLMRARIPLHSAVVAVASPWLPRARRATATADPVEGS